MIDLSDPKTNQARVAAVFKAQREHLNASLRDISALLEYKNNNFLSMVENGHSNPPLGRLGDFISAYQLPGNFVAIVIKHVYPAAWSAMCDLIKLSPSIFNGRSVEQVDKELDSDFRKLLRKFDID